MSRPLCLPLPRRPRLLSVIPGLTGNLRRPLQGTAKSIPDSLRLSIALALKGPTATVTEGRIFQLRCISRQTDAHL